MSWRRPYLADVETIVEDECDAKDGHKCQTHKKPDHHTLELSELRRLQFPKWQGMEQHEDLEKTRRRARGRGAIREFGILIPVQDVQKGLGAEDKDDPDDNGRSPKRDRFISMNGEEQESHDVIRPKGKRNSTKHAH